MLSSGGELEGLVQLPGVGELEGVRQLPPLHGGGELEGVGHQLVLPVIEGNVRLTGEVVMGMVGEMLFTFKGFLLSFLSLSTDFYFLS